MSLDKAIEHGKEKRRPYYGSKAIDPSCRNHGSCPWCRENRTHKFRDKSIEGSDGNLWIHSYAYPGTAAEEAQGGATAPADHHGGRL